MPSDAERLAQQEVPENMIEAIASWVQGSTGEEVREGHSNTGRYLVSGALFVDVTAETYKLCKCTVGAE